MSLSANYPAIRPSLLLDFINAPVLSPRVTFTRASSATYFDQLGVLQTAGNNAPRFDFDPATLACRGLLIEEQRTNSIRNNTMQGAVAGTPGTLPTNWLAVGAGIGTLTEEIVGVGVVNGISYIDLRLSGTTSTVSYGYQAEQFTAISAVSGQTWTGSMYLAIVGGSTANITSINLNIVERNSSATNIGTTSQSLSLTSTLSRYSVSRTLDQGASTAYVSNTIIFGFASGAAIDITLRIGLPQLEQGAFATSVIPTTTAAATRSADVASMTGTNFSSWFNASEGTLLGVATTAAPMQSGIARRIANCTNGTESNRIAVAWAGGTAAAAAFVADANVLQASFTSPSGAYPFPTKVALAYKQNDFGASVNGSAFASDTSGTIPTVNQMTIGDVVTGSTGAQALNGHVGRIAYYPSRLTNTQIQALTAS